ETRWQDFSDDAASSSSVEWRHSTVARIFLQPRSRASAIFLAILDANGGRESWARDYSFRRIAGERRGNGSPPSETSVRRACQFHQSSGKRARRRISRCLRRQQTVQARDDRRFSRCGFCRGLTSRFSGFRSRARKNEFGEVGRKAVHEKIEEISPAYARLSDYVKSTGFLQLMSDITGIPDLL